MYIYLQHDDEEAFLRIADAQKIRFERISLPYAMGLQTFYHPDNYLDYTEFRSEFFVRSISSTTTLMSSKPLIINNNTTDEAYPLNIWYDSIRETIKKLTLPDSFSLTNPLEVVLLSWSSRDQALLVKDENKIIFPLSFLGDNVSDYFDLILDDFSISFYDDVGVARQYSLVQDTISAYTVLLTNNFLSVMQTLSGKRVIIIHKMSKKIAELFTDPDFWSNYILKLITLPMQSLLAATMRLDIDSASVALTDLLKQAQEAEYTALEASNQDYTTGIESYIRQITNYKIAQRTNRKKQELLRLSMMHTNRRKGKIIQELTALQSTPNVLGVTHEGSNIKVLLDELKVDGVVPIGPYIITLNAQAAIITIKNINNPMSGFDHPHVNYNNPCWGNYSDILVHLSNGELATTMDLVQVFLSTWNPEDEWGINLIHWNAKYTFETFADMDMLYRLDRYKDMYEDIFGESFPGANTCPHCGEQENDNGYFDCNCECPDCGGLRDDCSCGRCEECGEEIDYCTCSYCPECGDNLNQADYCQECYVCSDCGCDCETEEEEEEEEEMPTVILPTFNNVFTNFTS